MHKTPNPIDVHVGNRVRMRRMLIGMSQEKLADKLGLTFQQVQKYEKGTNRISASRLYQIATHLGVPVQFFFEDMPVKDAPQPQAAGLREAPADGNIMSFLGSADGLRLNRYFARIEDAEVRRQIVNLVRALAERAPEND